MQALIGSPGSWPGHRPDGAALTHNVNAQIDREADFRAASQVLVLPPRTAAPGETTP